MAALDCEGLGVDSQRVTLWTDTSILEIGAGSVELHLGFIAVAFPANRHRSGPRSQDLLVLARSFRVDAVADASWWVVEIGRLAITNPVAIVVACKMEIITVQTGLEL